MDVRKNFPHLERVTLAMEIDRTGDTWNKTESLYIDEIDFFL